MIHARKDYNRFQDPAIQNPELLGKGATPIAEDEPVMLFRAKDKHFLKVLNAYANELDASGNTSMVKVIRNFIKEVSIWQIKHKQIIKEPDL